MIISVHPARSNGQILQQLNSQLDALLTASVDHSITIDPSYERLWQEIRRVVMAGGKRLRPLLCILAYSAFGGTNEAIYAIGCSQELLHISLLVHDDIMDRDYLRHGQPNIAGGYLQHYEGNEFSEHLANSAALLAGDLLLGMAYETIATSGFDASESAAITTMMGSAVFQVAAGQLLDMEASNILKQDNSLKIAFYKTSSYSFVGPLRIGAKLAGATDEQLSHMAKFGDALGVGFQLTDDLLGLFGNEQETGKPVSSDMREGKATFLIQETFRRAKETDRLFLEEKWGNSTVAEADLLRAQEIVTNSGAKQATEDLIAEYAAKARGALGGLGLKNDYAVELDSLIERVIKRQS